MVEVIERGVRLREMLKCAEREVAMRHIVYSRRVEQKGMSQAEADREIRLMTDIADYLRRDVEAL